jgi:dTDP-4-dehydrorhamnose 3,5-epimerase
MEIRELRIAGAFVLIEPPFNDRRGAFEVFWDSALPRQGNAVMRPDSICHSYNHRAGTLRGLHFQRPPHAQAKLVSCVAGAVWDVMVDLRKDSPSYLRWDALELSAASGTVVHVPRGCAHGFVTLVDGATLAYAIEGAYRPDAGGILRWDDPLINIAWPNRSPILSEQDRLAADYQE